MHTRSIRPQTVALADAPQPAVRAIVRTAYIARIACSVVTLLLLASPLRAQSFPPPLSNRFNEDFQPAEQFSHNAVQVPLKSEPRRPLIRERRQGQEAGTARSQTNDWWKIIIPLIVVSGLALLTVAYAKKHGPLANRNLPSEAFEFLGKHFIDARQSIIFVRCGSRILILGSTQHGLQQLSEVTDPVEVDFLAGACRVNRDDRSITKSFRTLLARETPVNTAEGALDDVTARVRAPKSGLTQSFLAAAYQDTAVNGAD